MVGDGFLSASDGNNRAILQEVCPGMADVNDKGEEKLDKLIKPKGRGWRMAAIDLRAPNGQLLEYQILPLEMNEAGKIEHQMYKQWRGKDVSKMTSAMRNAKDEADAVAADLYFDAWAAYLARTGQTNEIVKQIIKQARSAIKE